MASASAAQVLGSVLVVVGLLGPVPAGAAEVYRPRYRLAEDLAPVAEAVLGASGRVAVDPHGGALILAGEPRAVAEALATIRALDVRPAVWRIETTLTRAADLDRAGVRVSGWVDAGSVRIGRAGSPPGSFRVGVDGGEGRLERSFRGQVTVLDGSAADVSTGSTRVLRRRGEALLVPAPTGFRVVPRGRPDGTVELEISTLASEPVARDAIAFARSSTRIAVRPGETLVLASTGGSSEQSGVDLLGAASESGAEETAMLIRVERADAGDASPASSSRSP
jgi:hypothetical protein